MKIIIILLALCASVQAEVGVYLYTNGVSQSSADTRYVNSPTESVAQTFTGSSGIYGLTVSSNISVAGGNFVTANGKIGVNSNVNKSYHSKLTINGSVSSDEDLLTLDGGYIDGTDKNIIWADNNSISARFGVRYNNPMDSFVWGSLYNGGYNSTDLMMLRGDGNLTIASTLTVTGNAFSVGGSTFVVKNGMVSMGIAAATNSSRLDVRSGDVPIQWGSVAVALGQLNYASSSMPTLMAIGTGVDLGLGTNSSVRMVVMNATGNVGINTTTPTQKLEVGGNVQVSSGTISMSGTGAPTAGYALCLTAAFAMGHCTDAPGVGGACTCTTP